MTVAELKDLRDEYRRHLGLQDYMPPKVAERLRLAIEAMEALIRERESQ